MKKLLVWDCDETLWDGILLEGDDIKLPSGRLEFCTELHDRGVVQSVASRNDLSTILLRLESFNLTPFFLYPQADFTTPKSVMITTIMESLGLSKATDVIFVDDDRFQREEVAMNCDGVIAMDPSDLGSLIGERFFTKETYTDEDRKRVRRYREEEQRKASSTAYKGDYREFLESSEIVLTLETARERDWERIGDLFDRANRMSALGPEITRERVSLALIEGRMIAGFVSDKFGDYGLSCFAVMGPGSGYKVGVDALVLSCRLQGKGIGSAFLGTLINRSVGRLMVARYTPTSYNVGMKGLYEWYGFDCKQLRNDLVFSKRIFEPCELPGWVTVDES